MPALPPPTATWRRSTPATESGGFLSGTLVPGGMWLGSAKGLIYMCNAQGDIVGSFPAHRGRIYGLLPAWPMVWSIGDDSAVHIWDATAQPTPRLVSTLTAHKQPLRAMASLFVPAEGYLICTGDAEGVVCVWPMNPQVEPLARITLPQNEALQAISQMNDAVWFGCRRSIHIYALAVRICTPS